MGSSVHDLTKEYKFPLIMNQTGIDDTSVSTWANFNQVVQIEGVNSIKFTCLFVNAESLSSPEIF